MRATLRQVPWAFGVVALAAFALTAAGFAIWGLSLAFIAINGPRGVLAVLDWPWTPVVIAVAVVVLYVAWARSQYLERFRPRS